MTHMENNSNKRTQRTPAEIIAETEAKLERLRMKDAKQQAQTNPTVASLIEQKTDVQKDIREAKKILGNGPQSAMARVSKHEAWIEKINDSVAEAEDTLSSAEQRLAEIDMSIQAEVATILASKEISSEA
jgi:phytoene/squalene synthetase